MVHSGLVGIIDIPLVLTVMLCSDSEVTYGWGGGRFHTFKSHSYVHNRIIQEKNLHSIPPPFSCLRPTHTFQYERLIFKHMYDMFTRESESMYTPFSEDFVDLDILICLDVFRLTDFATLRYFFNLSILARLEDLVDLDILINLKIL